MSKWFRRTVGSVAGAAAVLLLSAGTAAPASSSDVAPNLEPQVPESLRTAVDAPNMIGDDFVDQSPYAGGSAPAVGVPVGAGTLER